MRIIHLSSLYPPAAVGGAERVAALLAEAQAAAGHEVWASSLTRCPEPPSERHGVATAPLAHRNPLWIEDSPRFPAPVRLLNKAATVINPLTAADFARLVDRVRPDVVHTHSMVELPPAVWARAAVRGVAVVHTLHDYDLLCIRAALWKNGQRCAHRHLACRLLSAPKVRAQRHINLVAAVSSGVLDRHLEHGLFGHLPPERRQVVWNPAALSTAAARPASGLVHRFGFLGRLVAQKGLGLLIEASRRLPAGSWTLTVAGTGPEEARFRNQAAGLPITFLGHQDAATFLGGIDTLVAAPVWDEPFGLTTLEAYAAGARVIGARIGVIGDFVERVDPGWSVPPNEPAVLAAAMVRAMNTPGRLDAARARALLNELAPAVVAERYLALYEEARQAVRARA